MSGESRVFHSPFHHPTDVTARHSAIRQSPLSPDGRSKDDGLFYLIAEISRIEIFEQVSLKIVSHRDFPRLAAFVVKVQHPLFTREIEIIHPQLRDRSDTGGCVNQHGNNRPIAQTDDVIRLDRGQQATSLLRSDLRRLPFHDLMPFGSHRCGWVQYHRVPRHQHVEAMS